MYSVSRAAIGLLRKVFRYLPLPKAAMAKMQSLYLTKVYSLNKKKALTSDLFGACKEKDYSSYKPRSGRSNILDIFVSSNVAGVTESVVEQDSPDIRVYNAFSEYVNNENERNELRRIRQEFEDSLLEPGEKRFALSGYCSVCQADRKFDVDYFYAYERNQKGRLIPNWRESVVCQQCGMKNRVRAAADLLYNRLAVFDDDTIYVTEQLTSFCLWLEKHYPKALGSEYLGADKVGGSYYGPLRHEDITRLSFDDNSLDIILSFDVLEHVPDTEKSLAEFIRCLKPGGFVLVSAPFASNQYETIVRAKTGVNGTTEHILEPEYHGNPTNPAMGSLCYYHFGWHLLDQLRSAGASDAAVLSYYSSERMNIGNEQLFFVALK